MKKIRLICMITYNVSLNHKTTILSNRIYLKNALSIHIFASTQVEMIVNNICGGFSAKWKFLLASIIRLFVKDKFIILIKIYHIITK